MRQANPVGVLIVDDDPHVLAVEELLLGRAGYAVWTAGGVPEALRLFAAHAGSIDLLLSDVTLPGADGYELVREIRNLSPYLPAVLTSGFVDEKPTSGVPFLPKPFNKAQLLAAVEEALSAGAGAPVRVACGGVAGA